MRSNVIGMLVVAAALSTLFPCLTGADEKAKDEPSGYVMITEGIVGGFVPAHVRRRTIIVSVDEHFDVFVMKQAKRNEEVTYRQGILMAAEYKSLLDAVDELGLFELPVEIPTGSQDIFALDTSIAVRDGKTSWRNGGPGGCVHGKSKVLASDKHKETFRAVMKLVNELADQHASEKGESDGFNAALKQVNLEAAKKGTARGKAAKF